MFKWLFGKSRTSDSDSNSTPKVGLYGDPMKRAFFTNSSESIDDLGRLTNKSYNRIRKALKNSPLKFSYCSDDNTMLWHHVSDRNWHSDPYGLKFVEAMIQVGHLDESEAVDAVLYFRKHCTTSHCSLETKNKRLAKSATTSA